MRIGGLLCGLCASLWNHRFFPRVLLRVAVLFAAKSTCGLHSARMPLLRLALTLCLFRALHVQRFCASLTSCSNLLFWLVRLAVSSGSSNRYPNFNEQTLVRIRTYGDNSIAADVQRFVCYTSFTTTALLLGRASQSYRGIAGEEGICLLAIRVCGVLAVVVTVADAFLIEADGVFHGLCVKRGEGGCCGD